MPLFPRASAVVPILSWRPVVYFAFLFIFSGGCFHRVVEISPVLAPVWLEREEPVPYEGWLVTQGWMEAVIEGTK